MTANPRDATTVYFTPEEVNRIRTTVSSALHHASQLQGTRRQPRDATIAIREVTAASLMADMAASCHSQDQGETLPILTVGRPYTPCTLPTLDLQPMRLSELCMETHHRGYKLILKRAAGARGQGLSPVVQLTTRSWTLVQDFHREGDVERLDVCLHTHQHGKNMLECPVGKALVVREPLFTVTEQGEATVRVDHPSDLEWLDSEEEAPGDAETAVQEARRCKERGNTALAARDPTLAYAHYTRGLSQLTKLQAQGNLPNNFNHLYAISHDLHRNRAHTNLLLNRLDAAKTDALSSLTGESAPDKESLALDSKAYYRAGCAAYNLGEYEEARTMFSRRLRLTPEVGDAAIKMANQRIHERDTGEYNLPKIRAAAALSRSREIDAASFVNKTSVEESPGRDRGLFAVCDVPAGGLVLCEKAFCVAWGAGKASSATAVTYDVRDGRIRLSPVGLVRAVVEKLRGTPSYIDRVLELYGDYRGDARRREVRLDGNDPVVDVFRIHDIVSRNAFGLDTSTRTAEQPGVQTSGVGVSTGLWITAARMNHSCDPNTVKEFIGDMMLIRAKRHIVAGEELLHSYVDETSRYRARQEALTATWGFECNCGLCQRQRWR